MRYRHLPEEWYKLIGLQPPNDSRGSTEEEHQLEVALKVSVCWEGGVSDKIGCLEEKWHFNADLQKEDVAFSHLARETAQLNSRNVVTMQKRQLSVLFCKSSLKLLHNVLLFFSVLLYVCLFTKTASRICIFVHNRWKLSRWQPKDWIHWNVSTSLWRRWSNRSLDMFVHWQQ